MSLIRSLIGFIFAILLVGFALANRQDTTLIYSPLHEPLTVPLYLITLLFLALGFVLGAVLTWLNGAPNRKTRRQQRKKIKELEKELDHINNDPKSKPPAPAAEIFPALPARHTTATDLRDE